MTGVVFDIKRGGIKDGPGLRTSVFLKGCPLRCVWCHNPESQAFEAQRAVTTDEVCGRVRTVEEVMREVRRDAVFYRTSGGGVTITGGEPLAQGAFARALAAAARAEGIHTALDTSAFAPWETLETFLPVVDLFLVDVKCMDGARHRALTGVDNAGILANIRRLSAAGAKMWIRCPLVPGLNDSDADLRAARAFIAGLATVEKVEICPYHPLGLEKCAKFGLPVRYDVRTQPTRADLARWRAALFA